MQKALKEGRLQFGEKPKMQVDTDPLKVDKALYSGPPDCMMVEATEGLDREVIMIGDIKVMMLGTNESFDIKMEDGLQTRYPTPEESLDEFQEKYRVKKDLRSNYAQDATLCMMKKQLRNMKL